MTVYRLNLEVGNEGSCMAHVVELPGCFTIGISAEQAIARAREAIAAFGDWLTTRGERVGDDAAEVVVAEEISVAGRFPGTPGDAVAGFATDLEQASPEGIERALLWLEWSRGELMRLFESLPAEVVTWQPPSSEWTIRQILEHIAGAEAWYLTRLEPPRPGYHFGLQRAVREWARQRLRGMSEEEAKAVRVHEEEEWTARKVLRRFLEHEQEHLAQLRTLLASYGAGGEHDPAGA